MTFDLTGRIAAVDAVPLGGVLAEDAPAGSTALVLEDTADFNEDGGTLVINSVEQVEYTTVDDEAGVVVLASPTTAAYDTEARVELFDPATGLVASEVQAQVLVEGWEDAGDSLTATVDHALIPYLATGIRDTDPATGLTGEAVALEWRGDELYVVDVLGRAPVFDGSVIDPDTLPPSYEPTPEIPVAPAAPTVLPGIGSLFVRWGGVTHPNPVTYEVYVSDTSPVTADPADMVAEVGGTAVTIRRLPRADEGGDDNTSLRYDTIYYVAVRAKDSVDGSYVSPLSGESQGSPVQATGDDIAVDSVTAQHIVAGQITGEKLAGEILLGSTIKTADSGQRVEMDENGLRLVGSDETVRVSLPTAAGEDARFRGQIEADGLIVREGAQFYSGQNEFARDATVTLAEAVSGPAVGPVAQMVWSGVTLQRVSMSGELGTFALNPEQIVAIGKDYSTTGRFCVVQRRSGGSRVWFYNMDGSLVSGDEFLERDGWEIVGYSKLASGKSVYLGRRIGEGPRAWYLYNGDVSINKWSSYSPADVEFKPKFAYTGSEMLITERRFSAPGSRVRRVALPSGGGGDVIVTENINPSGPNAPGDADPAFVYRGTADFGSTKWVLSFEGAWSYRVYDTSGNPEGERFWSPPTSKVGAMWDPDTNRFYTMGADGVLYQHTALTWTDSTLDTWHVGQSFRDGNATGGTHETALGAITSFTMEKRAGVRFTLADIPVGTGSADDPNQWRLYAKRGTPPNTNRTDMWLQTTGVTSTFTMTAAPVTVGTNPLTVGTFEAANPALLRSARAFPLDANKPVFQVKGDGSGWWGPIEVTAGGTFGSSYDTGWIALTLGSDVTAQAGDPPMVRRIGDIVSFKGRANKSSAGTAPTNPVATIPVAAISARPSTPRRLPVYVASGSASRFQIEPGGQIQVNGWPGGLSGTVGVDFSAITYML
jgi:hypothetical protein